MPKPRSNGIATAELPKDQCETLPPQTTPRRSKRKRGSDAADVHSASNKSSKVEVNGKVKSAASTRTPADESSKYWQSSRNSLPEEAQLPNGKPKTHRTLKERAKVILDKAEHEIEKIEHKVESVVDGKKYPSIARGRRRSTKKRAASEDSDVENELDGGVLEHTDVQPEPEAKPKRKRKTKEEKEAEMLPLAARTTGLRMFVGAHVSMAGGLENSVKNTVRIGGNAFALFLRSQKKWENPPLKEETRDAFRALAKESGLDQSKYTLPHGSYLVNLAVEDADRAKQSYDVFVDDLHRCESLGIRLYNFHPGHYSQSTLDDGIGRIARQLNRALSETKDVIPVLENAAGSGTVIGSRFSDLRDIIDLIAPEYKHRIGVCIDTCHAFAAGYDLRTLESFKAVLTDFDRTVGLQYLKALHINDSKAPFNSKRDLHQNIGLGFLGLRTFHNVMNESRFEGIPLVLETPCDVPDPADETGKKIKPDLGIWAREIKMLESLIGMDPESAEFKTLEKDLSEKGRAEREKMLEAMAKAEEKKAEKLKKATEKGQRSLKDMFGGGGKRKGKVKTKKKGPKDDEAASSSSSLSEDSEDI